MKTPSLWLPLLLILFFSCQTRNNGQSPPPPPPPMMPESGAPAANTITESFEWGTKRNYAAGDVLLRTGLWRLDGAVIGNSAKDHKKGLAALRIGDGGVATMMFNVREVNGISVRHGLYGTDTPARWSVWYASGAGGQWKQLGKPVTTTSASMKTVSFPLKLSGPVRFQIRKEGGGRVNMDDIAIRAVADKDGDGSRITGEASRDDNMAMGNPSGAVRNPEQRNNYLMIKPQFALSYNSGTGSPNWVSWHLSKAWRGGAERCNCFASDGTLPAGFNKVLNSHYIGTGFDRGHLCPSEDRDATREDNAATFLMTNMNPQAPFLNQQPWMRLEDYCRGLTEQGMELYIIAGGYGQGGTGSKGMISSIAGGAVTVPARLWKVIVILPTGSDDISRVGRETRIIAVDMPNAQSANEHNWPFYRTTADKVEAATGYDLLSNIPEDIQQIIEARKDEVKVE